MQAMTLSATAERFLETTLARGADLRWNDRFDWSVALQRVDADDWPAIMAALAGAEIRPLLRLACVYEWAASALRDVPRPVKPALCRLFMPPYDGPARMLFHGCLAEEEPGMSWTGRRDIAACFSKSKADKGEARIVAAMIEPEAIICHIGQYTKTCGEDEYVLDPALIDEVETMQFFPQKAARRRKPFSGAMVSRSFLASFSREMKNLRTAERNSALAAERTEVNAVRTQARAAVRQ